MARVSYGLNKILGIFQNSGDFPFRKCWGFPFFKIWDSSHITKNGGCPKTEKVEAFAHRYDKRGIRKMEGRE